MKVLVAQGHLHIQHQTKNTMGRLQRAVRAGGLVTKSQRESILIPMPTTTQVSLTLWKSSDASISMTFFSNFFQSTAGHTFLPTTACSSAKANTSGGTSSDKASAIQMRGPVTNLKTCSWAGYNHRH